MLRTLIIVWVLGFVPTFSVLAYAQAPPPRAANDAGSEQECVTIGEKIAAANVGPPLTQQLVKTHVARTTGHCYVLLTVVSGGSDGVATSTIRTLYSGEPQQVLALASDQGGEKSGWVFDPSYRSAVGDGYDGALGYMDSKMSFD